MIRFFAGHPTAANLLMILLFALGIIALPTMRRETFPDFSASMVEVSVAYAGASAEEIEEAVCQRIEDAIEGLTDVLEVRCDAREGFASATIEMEDGGDITRFLADVTTEVEAIDNFPDLAEDPVIRQLNRTDQVVSIAITGPMSEADLRVYAEEVRTRLNRLDDVSQATLQGFSERQIRIALDAQALRQHGLSVSDIAGVVERQSVNLPSGTAETAERDILVRFDDERRDPLALADLLILGSESGAEIRLGQIATITDRFENAEDRVEFDGRRAALIQVSKTKDQDTLTVMAAVRAFLETEQAMAPPGVTFALTRDTASIVEDRLDMLTVNMSVGLGLVFLVMWLFFSIRFSFWTALGLPASFAGTLFVMTTFGYSIDMMTMVALLIAVGLLMDDSVVIAENIATHLSKGASPLDAAINGTREVAAGVFSSFITSICVFAPLGFLAGDMGQVLQVVPIVLIMTLSVSLIEAFLILPHHMAHVLRHERPSALRRRFDAVFDRVRERGLGRLVDVAIKWRYLTAGLVVMVFLVSLSMLAGGRLQFQAFPELDGDVIEARILLPQGTPLAHTQDVVAEVGEALGRVDDAFAPDQPDGQSLERSVLVQYNTNADAFESGPHIATVTADLLSAEIRNARLDDVLNVWRREVGTIPDVLSLTFAEPTTGPAGQPIEIRLSGDDLNELNAAAAELMAWLGSYSGVIDLNSDLRPGKPEIRLRLREGALAMGLDASTIANQLRAAYQGQTASEIQVGTESFEIDVQLAPSDQDSLSDLDLFTVTLPSGGQVPLSAVAVVESGRGFARIARIDGRRTVTIRGDIDRRLGNLSAILQDTETQYLAGFLSRHPGVDVELEGEAANQAETQASLITGFMLGVLGIFLLLSFQFRSYIEPVIVMVAIPLGLIGVIWGHMVMGIDLTLPSIMGLASLSGIVVNDSILLVMFVKRNAAAGLDVVDAARQASRERFRPILITTATTIAGMLPLLFERSLQAQVLIPLVTSLVFGILAATVLILVVLPALYAILSAFGLTTVAKEAEAKPQPA